MTAWLPLFKVNKAALLQSFVPLNERFCFWHLLIMALGSREQLGRRAGWGDTVIVWLKSHGDVDLNCFIANTLLKQRTQPVC